MLDVHILNYQPNIEYWKQCLDSVELAIANAGYPVNLHITNGDPDLGKARQEAYSYGGYPYVTHVDNDDYVLPNAFSVLKTSLDQKPDAIFTKELRLSNNALTPVIGNLFHLNVYSRKILVDHNKYGYACDIEQRKFATTKKCIFLEDEIYIWRVYGDSPMSRAYRNLNSVRAK